MAMERHGLTVVKIVLVLLLLFLEGDEVVLRCRAVAALREDNDSGNTTCVATMQTRITTIVTKGTTAGGSNAPRGGPTMTAMENDARMSPKHAPLCTGGTMSAM